MGESRGRLQSARSHAGDLRQRDLPRGFTLALVLSSALVWIFSLAIVLYLSVPHQPADPAADDRARAAGRRTIRDAAAAAASRDEIGQAVAAFNQTADQLQQNRDRLVYLTQVASWQMLARKMAHELKNSLTPIRLTVEEIVARQSSADREFFERAARIVVDEVDEPRAARPRVLGVRRGTGGHSVRARSRRSCSRSASSCFASRIRT